MIFLAPQSLSGFGAVGHRVGLHPGRAEDFTDEFASKWIIVNDKNLYRHVIVPRVALDSGVTATQLES
jgi:hypothetical protein